MGGHQAVQRKKKAIWDNVVRKVNGVSGTQRSLIDCKKRWNDYRRKIKSTIAKSRLHESATGEREPLEAFLTRRQLIIAKFFKMGEEDNNREKQETSSDSCLEEEMYTMPDCIVIGCTSATRKGRPQPNVSFHVFPKTHDKIRIWLQQTNQYTPEQLEPMVQRIFDTNKTVKYRMCSRHFNQDCYYSHGVNKKLKPDAAPTIFPSRITHSEPTTYTSLTDPRICPLTLSEATASTSSAFIIENQPRINVCHACGHRTNVTLDDASTNTEEIVKIDNSTSFDPFLGTRSSSVQTLKTIRNQSKATSTRDYLKKKDQYTWTMGDMSADNSLQGSIASVQDPSSIPVQEIQTSSQTVDNIQIIHPIMDIDNRDNISTISNVDPLIDNSLIEHNIDSLDISNVEDMDVQSKDPTYIPETTEETQEEYSILEEVTNKHLVYEPKYIVFERSLDELIKLIPCRFEKPCSSPMMSVHKRVIGTLLIVTGECEAGHNSTLWCSQPTIGQKPVGNILACSSLLFTGNQFEKINDYFKYFGICFLSRQTFCNYQKNFLFPTVDTFWKNECAKNIDNLQGSTLSVTGDGQCDSPGFSAKYCIYTIMEDRSKKILDIQIVQVSEASSSVAMEAKGFWRAINSLLSKGLLTVVVATDRHVSIRKIIREDYKNINHQFDIWHYTKSLKKKIHSVGKKKKCAELTKWVPSIANHLWACSVSCQGDTDRMEKLWKSCLYHVLNIHSWEENGIEYKCNHGELQLDKDRPRKWLSKQSESFHELEKIVCDAQMIKDLKHLNIFCHTGKLEVFHSFVLKYRPKRILSRWMLWRLELNLQR
ncbi:uncharacterized protein LOC128638386 [Bombina bombina]|uniref:uncharacterized protein LOC128638386 n=1 Tax=Bombina bombina TaxID=8345 RepID=UPI00235AC20E|nr:uncharacterized protein LOC128638386 [Bombina bombina]XP_053546295.1 uncharacterized protein LOC128638386 [Bombina bombina]XP_053546296.1 uncharacterized protein LOC128638386 [Bombina bombina]